MAKGNAGAIAARFGMPGELPGATINAMATKTASLEGTQI